MVSFASIVFGAILTVPLVQAVAVVERQIDTGLTSTPPTSLTKTVTKVVVVTSTSTPPVPVSNLPITSRFIVTHNVSGQATLSTATVTILPVVRTSTLHRDSTAFPPFATTSADESNGNRSSGSKGAIAGGVLGALAVIIAVFAAFVWYRRRSPKHWRNRAAGRWHIVDNKDGNIAGGQPIYAGGPAYRAEEDAKQSDPRPLPPLYIRDRQPSTDLTGAIPSSPLSPRTHARSTSASISQGGDGLYSDIELQGRST